MTQEEFVKNESKKYEEIKSNYMCKDAFGSGFSSGLTKGIEIGKEFYDWCIEDCPLEFEYTKSTSELLTIFLTKKYGK